MDIAYKSESKILDIHIAENIKWNVRESQEAQYRSKYDT